MAAAVASGGVAILLQAQPNLTPDTVKARLMKTASKSFPASSVATDPTTGQTYTSLYDVFTIGAGYLDVWAALNSTDVIASDNCSASPIVSYDASSASTYIAN